MYVKKEKQKKKKTYRRDKKYIKRGVFSNCI